MTTILFLLVLFISNVIQAITGFAGTVLAMPPSIYLLGIDNAKVILNAMAIFSGLLILAISYKHVQWKELFKILIIMGIGMAIGVKLFNLITSQHLLLRIYGIIIILIALKNIFIPTNKKFNSVILWIILLLAGIIHGMFISGGALLVIYATQVFKDKQIFRATVAPLWIFLNGGLFTEQVHQGLLTGDNILLIIFSIIPLIIATWVGNILMKKVSATLFLKITYALLFISGLSLLK